MKKKLEELLMELAKLDTMNRVCANDAIGLLIAIDLAIESTETTMFDLHARSQEEMASQVHSVVGRLKDTKRDVEGLVNSSKNAVVSLEKMVNTLIWMDGEIEDAVIEKMGENCKNSLKSVENMVAEIKSQIAQTVGIAVDAELLRIF